MAATRGDGYVYLTFSREKQREGIHYTLVLATRTTNFSGSLKVYNVTYDLDLDLEHILAAGPSADRGVQVWSRFNHLPGRRSDLRKIFTDECRTDAA